MNNRITGFHAHIYFEDDSAKSAEQLRASIGETFGQKLRHWGKLIHRPIGPHPLPMFEVDFTHEHFAEVVTFLMQNHGQHSVLIHPETGNDLVDHTAHALWIGPQLRLDLSKLN